MISSKRAKRPRLAPEQLHRRHAGDVLLQEGVDAGDPGRARCGSDSRTLRRNHCVTSDDQRQHENATSASRQSIDSSTIMMPASVKMSPKIDTTPDGEHIVDHVDVGGDAGHQAADRVAVVELQVEALQMRGRSASACRT